jgi:hypothetical protein
MHSRIILLLLFALSIQITTANNGAKRLFDDLITHYNKIHRPCRHNEKLLIRLKLRLSQIIDVVRSPYTTHLSLYVIICSMKRIKL